MIDCWKVLSALREYYSYTQEDSELLPLCDAAAREVSARVRENADFEDMRLISAAAAIANYRLCVKNLHRDDGITSFKAGDVTVSVTPSATCEYAEKEKSRALLDALPLFKDDAFYFGQGSI